MHKVNSKLLEGSHVFHDLGMLISIFHLLRSTGAGEVVAATSIRISGHHWKLRMHKVNSKLLEGSHVFHDLGMLISILLLRSRKAIKEAASCGKAISLDRGFRVEMIARKGLQLASVHEDLLVFLPFLVWIKIFR